MDEKNEGKDSLMIFLAMAAKVLMAAMALLSIAGSIAFLGFLYLIVTFFMQCIK